MRLDKLNSLPIDDFINDIMQIQDKYPNNGLSSNFELLVSDSIYLQINHNLLPMIQKYVILKVRKFLPDNKNMKITSKGQVTIPVEIREKLGLTPNTEVEFEVIGDSVYLKKATVKPTPGKSLVEMMRDKATVKMTTDEIMTLTRQD